METVRRGPSIQGIADDGMADGREMRADLVAAPGFDDDAQ
jgi:hypothetical protein